VDAGGKIAESRASLQLYASLATWYNLLAHCLAIVKYRI
jgi:hypothetical protein